MNVQERQDLRELLPRGGQPSVNQRQVIRISFDRAVGETADFDPFEKAPHSASLMTPGHRTTTTRPLCRATRIEFTWLRPSWPSLGAVVIHPEAHSSCHLEKQQLPQVAESPTPSSRSCRCGGRGGPRPLLACMRCARVLGGEIGTQTRNERSVPFVHNEHSVDRSALPQRQRSSRLRQCSLMPRLRHKPRFEQRRAGPPPSPAPSSPTLADELPHRSGSCIGVLLATRRERQDDLYGKRKFRWTLMRSLSRAASAGEPRARIGHHGSPGTSGPRAAAIGHAPPDHSGSSSTDRRDRNRAQMKNLCWHSSQPQTTKRSESSVPGPTPENWTCPPGRDTDLSSDHVPVESTRGTRRYGTPGPSLSASQPLFAIPPRHLRQILLPHDLGDPGEPFPTTDALRGAIDI